MGEIEAEFGVKTPAPGMEGQQDSTALAVRQRGLLVLARGTVDEGFTKLRMEEGLVQGRTTWGREQSVVLAQRSSKGMPQQGVPTEFPQDGRAQGVSAEVGQGANKVELKLVQGVVVELLADRDPGCPGLGSVERHRLHDGLEKPETEMVVVDAVRVTGAEQGELCSRM